jgi:hypothetical protein
MFCIVCRVAIVFLASCYLLLAQEVERGSIKEMSNGSVIKLMKAGLSDDLIVSAISALPGSYDTSSDGLIALKAANASDKVVAAIVLKASSTSVSATSPVSSAPPTAELSGSGPAAQASVPPVAQDATRKSSAPAQGNLNGSVLAAEMPAEKAVVPRVFLQSASKGTNRNAARDQSMEMSKDLEKDCPGVRVTINQQMADYVILLNHIEVGFARDNQIQVANKDGDLLSKTKEGGSIASGMKKACALILSDWAKK